MQNTLFDSFQTEEITKPIHQKVKCWDCAYCDKESVKVNNVWTQTRTGYCMAENSAVNGKDKFSEKVFLNTIQNECSEYMTPENHQIQHKQNQQN
jgi:hypothetical protein